MRIIREKDLQEFEHFGVLGMKWGHRKAKISSNKNTNSKKQSNSNSNQVKNVNNKQEKTNKKVKNESSSLSRSDKIKLGASAVLIAASLFGQYKLNKIAGEKSKAFVDSWYNDTMRTQKLLTK